MQNQIVEVCDSISKTQGVVTIVDVIVAARAPRGACALLDLYMYGQDLEGAAN